MKYTIERIAPDRSVTLFEATPPDETAANVASAYFNLLGRPSIPPENDLPSFIFRIQVDDSTPVATNQPTLIEVDHRNPNLAPFLALFFPQIELD